MVDNSLIAVADLTFLVLSLFCQVVVMRFGCPPTRASDKHEIHPGSVVKDFSLLDRGSEIEQFSERSRRA